MSFWKYLFKTSLEQKKADWAEFQYLRQQVEDADNAVMAAHGRITALRDVNDKRQPDACIVRVIEKEKKMEIRADYCPYFYDSDNKNGCYRYHCYYADRNCQYHDACNAADELRRQVNGFWANKFAHTK